MTINLTDRRPTVRLTDRWEENHRPFDLSDGRKPPALNQRRKKQERDRHQGKEEAEGKPTEGRRKQREKMRNLRIPNDRNRKEGIKIKQSPAEYLKLKT